MTDDKRLARTRILAAWVRERLLQMGPTFIKLGQLFSTRSDLFPMEFTEELSKLQVQHGAGVTAGLVMCSSSRSGVGQQQW